MPFWTIEKLVAWILTKIKPKQSILISSPLRKIKKLYITCIVDLFEINNRHDLHGTWLLLEWNKQVLTNCRYYNHLQSEVMVYNLFSILHGTYYRVHVYFLFHFFLHVSVQISDMFIFKILIYDLFFPFSLSLFTLI